MIAPTSHSCLWVTELRDPSCREMVAERNLPNVHFVGYQAIDYLSTSLSAADVHLVTVDPRVIRYLMPSKLYGVLASGTPVIAIAPSGSELARIVEEEQVGRVATPLDPGALAARIVELADLPYDFGDMGDRARRLAVGRFDRGASVQRFREVLGELTPPQPMGLVATSPAEPALAPGSANHLNKEATSSN